MWVNDYYRGIALALADDTLWDEFIRQGWYEGMSLPSLPGMTNQLQGENVVQAPIDLA